MYDASTTFPDCERQCYVASDGSFEVTGRCCEREELTLTGDGELAWQD